MGEDLLICDLAQTYHVLNYKELSPSLVATLMFGLPDSSRIKMKMANQTLTLEQMLIARQIDVLDMLLWTKTKDAQKGRNKPESILNKLLGNDKKKKDDLVSFATPEEYEAYMASVRGK